MIGVGVSMVLTASWAEIDSDMARASVVQAVSALEPIEGSNKKKKIFSLVDGCGEGAWTILGVSGLSDLRFGTGIMIVVDVEGLYNEWRYFALPRRSRRNSRW
jgi:hypothetical protein